jgi:precorrin-6B methylase 2
MAVFIVFCTVLRHRSRQFAKEVGAGCGGAAVGMLKCPPPQALQFLQARLR